MKRAMKTLADGVALVMVLPCWLGFLLGSVVLGRCKAFPGWSQAMSLPPGLVGTYLRRAFYRLVFPRCGADCCLSFGAIFSHPTAEVGRAVYVGPFCCLGDVTLEDDVLIGSHVSITNGTAQHGTARLDIPVREQPGAYPRVTVGRDTWIGDRAVVMADVGRHCVIGAGSVVTKPVPDYAIAVGSPARVIGSRQQAAASRSDEEQQHAGCRSTGNGTPNGRITEGQAGPAFGRN
jgi:acetyltransferase-like isoleucine patch superfamily enzyme